MYTLKRVPILDPDFRPAYFECRDFSENVEASGKKNKLIIALERENGNVFVRQTYVFPSKENETWDKENFIFVERMVKTLLWMIGGFNIYIAGDEYLAQKIKQAYSKGGLREFDYNFMSTVYETEVKVIPCTYEQIPTPKQQDVIVSGKLNGCRIGFDAGGSDRKVAAVRDGEVLYSEEVVWHPKVNSDPTYHYEGIKSAIKTAASYLPHVDALGVSSAGLYVNNRTMIASLFIKVKKDDFEKIVKNIYLDIAKDLGISNIEVKNDGDVAALAGAISLNDTNILGIAMGTSEAVGYINGNGNITGYLNELAFVPVDFNPFSMVDEWSGDYGCGVKYFSQDSVIKLAPRANISLDPTLTPAEKLKVVQGLMEQGDARAVDVYKTIGTYLGYTLAYYADFYEIKHILVLGRVSSGEGGNIIVAEAEQVLKEEFPDLYKTIKLNLPDESDRRVGQAIAAASIPVVK